MPFNLKKCLVIMFVLTLPLIHERSVDAEPDSLYGGELVMGTSNAPTIMNPLLTTHSVSAALASLLFNSLVRVDKSGNHIPDLAERWEISDDRLTYTFYLRKGVKFHDGTELTAKDVLFTYQAITDPENKSPFKFHFDLVERFEALDRYTFRVVLTKPFEALIAKLTRYIVPAHHFKGKNIAENSFNHHPIGTGPFRFQSWDFVTNEVRLEANKSYHEGRPYLDRIIVKTYPNVERLWAAFMRQEVDFVRFISWEDYQVIRNEKAVRTYQVSWTMYAAIYFDLQDPILKDKSIRKAIAHAIDIEELIENTTGEGIKATGPFHPNSIGYNTSVKALEYDPALAREILKRRGWMDRNNDGILEKGGKPLEIRMLIDQESDFYENLAMLIRQNLAEIGIKLTVVRYDRTEEVEQKYKLADHQAWLRFFSGLGFDGYDAMASWYSSSSQLGKMWTYRNPRIDALFEAAQTVKDQNERGQIYQEMHTIIYDDQPACFLFFPVSFHAVSGKFRNTDDFFTPHMPMYTLREWYKNPT